MKQKFFSPYCDLITQVEILGKHLLKFLKIFNWRITALQCCVGFCCTTVYTSHKLHTYIYIWVCVCVCSCCSVAKLCPTLCNQTLQHTWFPCASLSSGVCSNSGPLSQWCYLTISSSATLFSFCLQSFPVSGSFPISQHINLYIYIFIYLFIHIYIYIYIPSLWILLSTSLISHPSRYHRVPDWAPSVILKLPTSYLFYTW